MRTENTGVEPATLSWLRTTVQEVLRLPADDLTPGPTDLSTLQELGARSIHVVALQFRILQETAVTVEMPELVGGSRLVDLAALIDGRR